MKDMIKVTLSLVVNFIAAGLIMALTYMQTSPVRFVAEKKEHEEALKLMAPEAMDPIHMAGTWTIHGKPSRYYDATSGGKTVAYIADTSGKGYSSYIQMMVSVDTRPPVFSGTDKKPSTGSNFNVPPNKRSHNRSMKRRQTVMVPFPKTAPSWKAPTFILYTNCMASCSWTMM